MARPIRIPEDASPETLAVLAQRGSTDAFGRLVSLFHERLYNFLLRRVGRSGDADDLTQEAFLRAWERIESYRPQWKFSTWLYTIAMRLAVSRAREQSRRRVGGAESESEFGLAIDEAKPERDRQIWVLVDRVLTEEQRDAVWLRYVEDLSISEIGAVMERTNVAVRVMLFRARKMLAEELKGQAEVVVGVRSAAAGGVR